MPLDRVAAIKDEIVARLRAELGDSEIAVTVVPRALDSETVLERVMVIARNLALAVHHVTVHAIANRLSVSLDLEVDGNLPLGTAHEIASRLETAIQEELGTDVEVETHIEPLQTQDIAGADAPADRTSAVSALLSEIAAKLGSVREVHDVRMRETAGGRNRQLSLPCRSTALGPRRAREGGRAGARLAPEFPDHQAGDRARRAVALAAMKICSPCAI